MLFRRERTNTHLTELGRLMRPHLESIYATSAAVWTEAENFRRMKKAPLTLGVMCTIVPIQLTQFFGNLRADIPSLDLQLEDAPATRLIDMLIDGKLDLALVGLPAYPERCDVRPLFRSATSSRFRGGTAMSR